MSQETQDPEGVQNRQPSFVGQELEAHTPSMHLNPTLHSTQSPAESQSSALGSAEQSFFWQNPEVLTE